jgi:hypothetical protein
VSFGTMAGKIADRARVRRLRVGRRRRRRLRIFDAQYVAENVYFGDEIGTDQRRVMLGKAGVDLANAYDAVDDEITAKNGEIRDVRTGLVAHVPAVGRWRPWWRPTKRSGVCLSLSPSPLLRRLAM